MSIATILSNKQQLALTSPRKTCAIITRQRGTYGTRLTLNIQCYISTWLAVSFTRIRSFIAVPVYLGF